MSMGGSYYELDKPVVYGVHEGEIACAAVASGADTVLDLQTLFSRAWAQDYITVYLDASPGAICTWALNNTGATVAAAGAVTARRSERILSKGRRYLVLRMVSGTGTIRAWGSSVSPLSAAAAVNPFIDFSAIFDMALDFTGTLDDATPGAYDDFTAVFTMSMGFEPLNLDAGVALPVWTTGGTTAVGYAADIASLQALSPGAVVTSLPPIDGTGGTFGESVGGGNHVTYQPTQLDSQPTLAFDGASGNGLTYTGASAPVSYYSGNDLPMTAIVRGRFTGTSLTGHLFGFGNSGVQDPFWHSGTASTNLWQYRKRSGAAGGGTGPQAGATDTSAHTFVVNSDGTVADQFVDGSATASGIAQNEGSTTFDRVSLGTLHRNTTPPAGNPFEGRRWIFANTELNATDVANGSLWVQTSAVYSTRTRLKVLLLGSSTAAGFGPVTSYLELLAATYDLELFDFATNGLESAECRATGSTQEPWAPAVLTTNNITAGLTACPAPDLVVYHVNTDVAQAGFDVYEAHGSWPGGTTWIQYMQTYAIPYIQEVQTAVEALGAEFVCAFASQPSDAPTTAGYPLSTYTQRRADADVEMKAAFGLKYWDRLRTLMLDTGDGTCLAGMLQGDNNHPTGATHILIAAELAAHIKERCPRSAPYFVP